MLIVNEWNENISISIKDIIDTLNELIDVDHNFVNTLISTRFPCNDKLRDHKSVQVSCTKDANNNEVSIAGFLGVLNGILGIDRNKYGAITMILDSKNKVEKFRITDTKNNDKK